ncbi:MAG: DNA cytosine methyltransferase [Planctomycetota bacterium]
MNELALFAGAGGGILGGLLSGFRTGCAVEIDPYCRRVLLARQKDGMLQRFPIWDDICTFDGRPWEGSIDVITGGFPCQDISAAGKGQGLTGKRSGLWFEMLRVIGEVRPRFIFAENSPLLRTRGLGTILDGLDSMGYNARWCVLGARHVYAPHRRDRLWMLAYSDSAELRKQSRGGRGQDWKEAAIIAEHGEREHVADSDEIGRHGWARSRKEQTGRGKPADKGWREFEPTVGRVADGVAHRVDRLKAIGNGQVPAVAALAWEILTS